MSNVLISTIYEGPSVIFAIKKFDIDKVILLVDTKPNEKQRNSMKSVREIFGNIVEVREERIDVYNIVDIVRKIVDIIDSIPDRETIFVNMTDGRKPQSLAVTFAAYQRMNRIKKIVYITEEKKEILTLPVLTFNLNDSQLEIMRYIDKLDTINKLENKLKIGRAMIYRNLKDLQNRGFIEKAENGLKLTDAGKIAIL